MKRLLLILLAAMMAAGVYAQQMVIEDFHLNISDQTANNTETQVIDDNGNPCALLKIETLQKDFSFDGGTVGIAKVEENHKGEIWVYVPATLRRITIAHDQLGVLRDWVFPEALQPARVYVMRLVSGSVQTVVQQKGTSQFFVLTFEPADAMVEIDGTIVETSDGSYSGYLAHGRHEFRISMNNYHTEAGYVEIGTKRVDKFVKLNPAFGWIEIKGPSGASVYIDNRKVGFAPMKSEPVASGSHDVRVVREKYLPYREQVLVNDNTTVTVNPTLTANFVTVSLTSDAGAEIWVNGERKGTGTVSIDLTPGEYTFETRKVAHRSQSVVRNITMASGGTIELPAPVAITGTLMVNVKPVGARIIVDGKDMGDSPRVLEGILIGTHDVVIRKEGCAERRESVEIVEGQTYSMEGKLAQGQDVRLSCGVETAHWMVDGVDRGTGSEITVNLSYSEHSVVIKAEGYNDFSESFTVGTSTTNRSFAMKKPGLETITVNGVSFNMRRVEGGTFQMGSNDGDDNEKPVHSVTLSDYYIGETEVTQALWEAVMGDNPSRHKGDNLPVQNVSWHYCRMFIQKLNQLTGRQFALPTEAQWEFAARGGNKERGYRYSGSDNLDDVGWNWNNSGDRKTTGDWSKNEQVFSINCQTHPVGTKKANELGIYDMSGNVSEWCLDWYGTYNNYSETNPTGPTSGLSSRVLRGGSWIDNARDCRSAERSLCGQGLGPDFLGFRLVMIP